MLPDLTRGDSAKKKRGEPTGSEATTMDEKQVEDSLAKIEMTTRWAPDPVKKWSYGAPISRVIKL